MTITGEDDISIVHVFKETMIKQVFIPEVSV